MSDPAAFIPYIIKPNRDALERLITKPEVERKLLLRLQKKAATYAQDLGPDGDPIPPPTNGKGPNGVVNGNGYGKLGDLAKLDVDGVVDLYESYIIPLTKEVEVSRIPDSWIGGPETNFYDRSNTCSTGSMA